MGFCKHSDEVLDFIITWNVLEDLHCVTSAMKMEVQQVPLTVLLSRYQST
jgi:hypothetical protein